MQMQIVTDVVRTVATFALVVLNGCSASRFERDLAIADIENWRSIIQEESLLFDSNVVVGFKVHRDMYTFRVVSHSVKANGLTARVVDRVSKEFGFSIMSKHLSENETFPVFFHLRSKSEDFYVSSGVGDDNNTYIFVVRPETKVPGTNGT
jgi:hypothetical protein